MRLGPTLTTCILLGLAPVAQAEAPAAAPSVTVKTHDPGAARVIGALLTDEHYWDGAWRRTYTGRSYDEIRMKEVEHGFLPRITGEGGRDVPGDVIAEVIFQHFDELPAHLAPAERALNLGRGHDAHVGAEYSDSWFFLDVPFMYIEFSWRLYRARTPTGSLLWFEKLTPAIAGAETWSRYQTRIDAARATVDRKPVFGSIVEPTEAYGLFIVEPGAVHESRVTFVARVLFGAETGWLASYASQVAIFLRTALAQAFDAALAISMEHARPE
jgi:hypothetical protein